MSDDSLTQHQQDLKSLRSHLLEICEDRLTAQKYFLESQDQARAMWHHINKSSNDAKDHLSAQKCFTASQDQVLKMWYRINNSSHNVSDLLVWVDEMIANTTSV